jgi:hypothetical protein
MTVITASQLSSPPQENTPTSKTWIAKEAILVARVACAAIGLISSFRFAGALAGRCLKLFQVSEACIDLPKETLAMGALKCTKVGLTALCIASFLASIPSLTLACLAGNFTLQYIQCIQALIEDKPSKAYLHAGFFIAGALSLTATLISSSQLALASTLVSFSILLLTTIKTAYAQGLSTDALCYALLSVIRASKIKLN